MKTKLIAYIFLTALLITQTAALAQESIPAPLTFQNWKEQQILDAQNQLLRLSTHINQLKSGKSGAAEPKDATAALPTRRVKKASGRDLLATAEKDLKRAQEGLSAAHELQLEDYINIYLPSLESEPDALDKLAEQLTKDELAALFKGLMRKASKTPDAQRSKRLLIEAVSFSPRSSRL